MSRAGATTFGVQSHAFQPLPLVALPVNARCMQRGLVLPACETDEAAEYAVVGMGSASGALYSANFSLRMLPLADVYLPYSRLVSPSLPLGRLLEGSLGDVVALLHAVDGPRTERPSFEYKGKPLPPGDTSLWASLRAIFGGGSAALDGGVSAAHAWERLRSEVVELRGREAVQRGVQEHGTIELPLDLFCVRVGGKQLPVYIDVATR